MDFAKIRPRGGTKAQWETANPVLGKREMGIQWESEIGVGKVVIKFGNGVTAWNNLDTAVEVENDLVNKIISSIVTVSDEYPILNDGDSLSTLVGKIKKYIQDLKDKKLDKSARYDGTDSTSTELVPTANALRGVNAKADKNASDITTLNNNLSKKLSVGNDIASADLLNDIPDERFGTLSMQFSDGTVNQLLLLKDTAAVTIFRNNEWTEQYRFATKSDVWPQNPGTQIAAGTDMQTITTPGHYYCENNSTAGSLKNCPISDAFTLVVYRAAGGSGDNIYYVAQEYTSYLCNRRVIQTYNKDSKNWTTHEIQFKS